ncbi:polysaccharide biosynthesis protein [Aliigemmobacter aestuarii]|uniref:polysaccharide biosynthesis protein n=1 Tax=Aliigemmobacter aestuarii TaxID=1445661 RepID=UPI0037433BB3
MRQALFAYTTGMSRPQKRLVFLLVDAILAPAALMMTLGLFYSGTEVVWNTTEVLLTYLILGLVAAAVSAGFGLHRIKLKSYESSAILKTGGFTLVMTLALLLLTRLLPVPGVILFGLVLFLLAVAARVVMLYTLLWVLRLGQSKKRVLIYGAGTTGTQLVAALRSHETLIPVAFVDDNPGLHSMTVAGLKVIPSQRIGEYAADRGVDRVVLAMPSVSAPKLAQITRRLRQQGLQVQSLPSFAQLVGEEALIDKLTPVTPGQFLGRQQHGDSLPQGTEAYAGRSILVSGAGGSVGSELCRQLIAMRPRKLVLFEISELALYTIDRELRDAAEGTEVEICAVLGSVTDSRLARMVMIDHDVEVVFHAAAYKHVPLVEANPIAGLANNVLGTRTFADAANDTGVERFILISTDKAVRPTNVMGASKRLAELVVQDLAKRSHGTVFSMVRFGNVLGSSGSVIPLFKDQIARGGPITLTHEDVTRYFMTISEAARLVLLAGSFADGATANGGDVFVLDMGKPVRIRDLAVQMINAAGYSVRDSDNPNGDIEIVITGLRPGEKLHEELLIGEGLLTTPHSKILRAREAGLSELEMANALKDLRDAIVAGDAEAGRGVILRWVDGYHQPRTVANSQ